jgi:hypothetical protein
LKLLANPYRTIYITKSKFETIKLLYAKLYYLRGKKPFPQGEVKPLSKEENTLLGGSGTSTIHQTAKNTLNKL